MGGMDCRLLTHLLNYGHQAEIDATPEGETVSELFTGGHDWIGKQTNTMWTLLFHMACHLLTGLTDLYMTDLYD